MMSRGRICSRIATIDCVRQPKPNADNNKEKSFISSDNLDEDIVLYNTEVGLHELIVESLEVCVTLGDGSNAYPPDVLGELLEGNVETAGESER